MSEAQPEQQLPQEPAAPVEPAEPEVEYAQIPVEQWEQIQQTLQQVAPLAEYVQQLPQEPQYPEQTPQPVQLDPFADDFTDQLRNFVQEQMAPVASYTQEQQLAEATEQARDILTDHLKTAGYEYMNESSIDRALELANHYVGEEQARYGPGLEAAEKAIQRAADEIRDWEHSVGEAYAQQQQQQVQRVMGAPQQPQQAGAPAAQTLTTTPGGPQGVFQKYYGGR